MSGIIKGIKKVFKKIGKVIKKIIKPLAIAVAVYFTAGLALSYFGATAGFAASMPGFAGGGVLGTGIGAGATAGTGIFSSVASAIGLGSGLAEGALVGSNLLGGLTGVAAATPAQVASTFGASTAASAMVAQTLPAGTSIAPGVTSTVAGNAVGLTAPAGAGGAAAGSLFAPTAAKAGLSLADKVIVASGITQVAGAVWGPSPEEEWEAKAIAEATFRKAFYGMEADGSTAPAPPQVGSAPTGVPQPGVPQPAPAPSSAITPQQQQLMAGREKKQSLFPTAQSMPQTGQTTGPGQMQQQFPIPGNVSAPQPGVRYA